MFKRKVNVYALSNEKLDRLIINQKTIILEAQELLSYALSAQEQIEFNIKFNRQATEAEFGIKPALPAGW
jgi:hypothetical protein